MSLNSADIKTRDGKSLNSIIITNTLDKCAKTKYDLNLPLHDPEQAPIVSDQSCDVFKLSTHAARCRAADQVQTMSPNSNLIHEERTLECALREEPTRSLSLSLSLSIYRSSPSPFERCFLVCWGRGWPFSASIRHEYRPDIDPHVGP